MSPSSTAALSSLVTILHPRLYLRNGKSQYLLNRMFLWRQNGSDTAKNWSETCIYPWSAQIFSAIFCLHFLVRGILTRLPYYWYYHSYGSGFDILFINVEECVRETSMHCSLDRFVRIDSLDGIIQHIFSCKYLWCQSVYHGKNCSLFVSKI